MSWFKKFLNVWYISFEGSLSLFKKKSFYVQKHYLSDELLLGQVKRALEGSGFTKLLENILCCL